MKVLDKKKWIGIFAVLALLAIIGLAADMLVSQIVYHPDDTFQSIFYKILPAVTIALCSFSSAVMMNCRNTKATRSKNQTLNLIYGLLTLVFAFAAAYYPFFGADRNSLVAIAVIAVIIAVTSILLSNFAFKDTYQKIIMVDIAEKVIISTVIIAVICALAMLIPQKLSYVATQMNIARTGKPEGPFKTTVPFLPFAGASAPVMTYLILLKDALPKLRFSEKLLFAAACLWTLAVIAGSVISGRLYLSNAVFGAIIGYIAVLLTAIILNKRKKD